ncbi:cupredoxin domain-containing protein [Candidatus Micrarchaeota archaeon]|nr:cupredoxin domain-containing protein [Candidatus Micrarchaeota archaeon]
MKKILVFSLFLILLFGCIVPVQVEETLEEEEHIGLPSDVPEETAPAEEESITPPALPLSDETVPMEEPAEETSPPAEEPAKIYTNEDKPIIDIKDMQFVPSVMTVKKGTVITWINRESAKHVVKFGEFDYSNVLISNNAYKRTFNETGEFDYECNIHPEMKGKIIVVE